jgi:hypothetical protein
MTDHTTAHDQETTVERLQMDLEEAFAHISKALSKLQAGIGHCLELQQTQPFEPPRLAEGIDPPGEH